MKDLYMRPIVPVAVFASGVALIALAVASGEAEVSLILVFPLVSGSGGLFMLGTVLIVFSFVVGFAMLAMGQLEVQQAMLGQAGGARQHDGQPRTDRKYGGVVLIGPIPVAFGSDKTIALVMLVAGIVMAIVFLGLLIALL